MGREGEVAAWGGRGSEGEVDGVGEAVALWIRKKDEGIICWFTQCKYLSLLIYN